MHMRSFLNFWNTLKNWSYSKSVASRRLRAQTNEFYGRCILQGHLAKDIARWSFGLARDFNKPSVYHSHTVLRNKLKHTSPRNHEIFVEHPILIHIHWIFVTSTRVQERSLNVLSVQWLNNVLMQFLDLFRWIVIAQQSPFTQITSSPDLEYW